MKYYGLELQQFGVHEITLIGSKWVTLSGYLDTLIGNWVTLIGYLDTLIGNRVTLSGVEGRAKVFCNV